MSIVSDINSPEIQQHPARNRSMQHPHLINRGPAAVSRLEPRARATARLAPSVPHRHHLRPRPPMSNRSQEPQSLPALGGNPQALVAIAPPLPIGSVDVRVSAPPLPIVSVDVRVSATMAMAQSLPDVGGEFDARVSGRGFGLQSVPAQGGTFNVASAGPAVGGYRVPAVAESGSSSAGPSLPALSGDWPLADVAEPRRKIPLLERPHMLMETRVDELRVAALYGDDLREVPKLWHDQRIAEAALHSLGVSLPARRPLLLEVYSGCGNLTRAAIGAGWGACPPIDCQVAFGTGGPIDLLTADGRRLVWETIAAFKPYWVHLAWPCTFWSRMAHFTRDRSPEEDYASRLQSLAHIMFAKQVAEFQIDCGRHVSFEQPPACLSWKLELVQDLMRYGGDLMPRSRITADGCCYGAVDPGNGLPYKKAFGFWANFDISPVAISCHGRHAEHQRVHQAVKTGPRAGVSRTRVSGEYPEMLCSTLVASAVVAIRPVDMW